MSSYLAFIPIVYPHRVSIKHRCGHDTQTSHEKNTHRISMKHRSTG